MFEYRVLRVRAVCWFLLTCAANCAAAEPESSARSENGRAEQRIAWTTSRLVGSPDPPSPYRVRPAFPKLKFRQPLDITNAPGIDRLFVAEQQGRIYSFDNDPQTDRLDLAVNLRRGRPDFSALYGLAFDPDYEHNRFVYVCYVVGAEGQSDGTRVVRFSMLPGDPPRIDPDSQRLIITWMGGGHNGGCLKFGPDGYLYISTGDAGPASPPDPLRSGQDLRNVLSAILRIDVHAQDGPNAYRIPADNPFVDLPEARGEIWSYGFRNPWKMSFDRLSGELWVGDVGWEMWEMVYRVQKGGNYGWSIMEGRQPVHPQEQPGPTPILPPIVDHPHSEAASITGGVVYHGQRLRQLQGAYIYGDFQSGLVFGLRMDGDQVAWRQELARTPLQLVGFGEDNAGELFLLDYRGQIFELEENSEPDTSRQFPQMLSQTGLFTSVAGQVPAAGVVPYSINAQAWGDHTDAERWLAVPGAESITIDSRGKWQFPDGSVLAKTISLKMEQQVANSSRRLETQILHRRSGVWQPYTYIWNDEQTDATLAPADGLVRTYQVIDPRAAGGLREQQHRFYGRRECVLCHTPWVEAATANYGIQSASPLAVRSAQLDLNVSNGDSVNNQLQTLRRLGLITQHESQANERPLADPYDQTADLDQRARAYLDVNCSHCHQFNAGGSATILLSATVPLDETRTLDVRPAQGSFGISDGRIIAPGDPLGSVLFYRIAKLGGGRMPRIGSQEIDIQGTRLIYQWIHQRTGTAKEPSPKQAALLEQVRLAKSVSEQTAAIQELIGSTRGALALLMLTQQPDLDPAIRQRVVDLTSNHAASEVRDLFERFVPPSQRVKRLGTTVDATEILNLPADAERGKQVFLNDSAACKNCHRIDDVGQPLGPDLSQIGKKYDSRQLLQQILEPSNLMDPQYVPYVVETRSGEFLTGLLEQQSDEEVILRDANNRTHHISAADIEMLVRQQKSLMPDLLLRDMTPQQVADLIAYLASLK
jgi:uncharacterized repeat protein (TIGR03806 family)